MESLPNNIRSPTQALCQASDQAFAFNGVTK